MGFLTRPKAKKRSLQVLKSNSNITNNSKINKSNISSFDKSKILIHSNSINNSSNSVNNKENINVFEPPNKKRKIKHKFKAPKLVTNNKTIHNSPKSSTNFSEVKYFRVFYAKRSFKKHKDWMEGVLTYDGKRFNLQDIDTAKYIIHKPVIAKKSDLRNLKPDADYNLFIGSWEVQIDSVLDNELYESGKVFVDLNTTITTNYRSNKNNKKFKPKKFKNPFAKSLSNNNSNNRVLKHKNNPNAENAFILNKNRLNKDFTAKEDKVAVVVDKSLTKILRPHQKTGVKFLYDCVMGYKNEEKFGCILADDMGLGKTLQSITVIYTLLTDGPEGRAVCKKVLIVVPTSLINNWYNEFNKWLGSRKLQVLVLKSGNKSEQSNNIIQFTTCSRYKVLISGYEMIIKYTEYLINKVDLLVLDEAHRIKNKRGNKTINKLLELNVKKRILLTGTPIQNNLSELFAMSNFAIPNVLSDYKSFNNTFGNVISNSRNNNCNKYNKKLGELRSKELNKIINKFILRRSNKILRKYLKPKDEFIIFHKLSNIQLELYKLFINNIKLLQLKSDYNNNFAFTYIVYLRMLCISPYIIAKKFEKIKSSLNLNDDMLKQQNVQNKLNNIFYNKNNQILNSSIKIKVLKNLILGIYNNGNNNGDRIVLVSNFTVTLDLLEKLFKNDIELSNLNYVRLDGSINTKQRQLAIDKFNNKYNNVFLFLLSSKAGGCGLNLIGGNYLILLDNDWNPARDNQAMARIWRDGQLKRCKIYRLVSIGTIEESILQRQIYKMEVSDIIVDNQKNKNRHFNKDELKKIFEFNDYSQIKYCKTLEKSDKNKIQGWNTITNYDLIKPIIFRKNNNDINVTAAFTRTIDPSQYIDFENENDNEKNNSSDEEEEEDEDEDDDSKKDKQVEESDDDDEEYYQPQPLSNNNNNSNNNESESSDNEDIDIDDNEFSNDEEDNCSDNSSASLKQKHKNKNGKMIVNKNTNESDSFDMNDIDISDVKDLNSNNEFDINKDSLFE